MKILYLHGWHSVPGGVKPTFLAQHGHEVLNPSLSDEDFAAAVQVAQAELERHQPDVIVGSSRGAAVAITWIAATRRSSFSARPGRSGERQRRSSQAQ